MAEKVRCEKCDRNFKDAEGLVAHNKAKHPELAPKKRKVLPVRKIKSWGIFIIIAVLIVLGLYWLISGASNAQALPPTDMTGHIESNPSSHVLKEPMDIRVQKHMLEHVDGKDGAGGGVIINYNCKDFGCESGLVEKLESFAGKYDYVYVAPFKNMPVKIALTRLGRIEKLDGYDEGRIEVFITGRVS